MRRISTIIVCAAPFLLLFGCKMMKEAIVPVNLRTEYLLDPIGIDTQSPRFTWELKGEKKDFIPARSEIQIGTTSVTIPIGSEATIKAGDRTYEVKGGSHKFTFKE